MKIYELPNKSFITIRYQRDYFLFVYNQDTRELKIKDSDTSSNIPFDTVDEGGKILLKLEYHESIPEEYSSELKVIFQGDTPRDFIFECTKPHKTDSLPSLTVVFEGEVLFSLTEEQN
ncbi:hypothetical protein [Marinoscillum sp.]|uniref:hypothetical protein n=1 Tax=Marinoscillum sp. TaxID=2024838 RepID=UPI003BA92704